ncbi:hypothetical protein BDQ17DRAFT_1548260 [Cyathus striatus]|nr:hypothetical protein BDQ17DRAFT_1548260 [Cyathus striatus]
MFGDPLSGKFIGRLEERVKRALDAEGRGAFAYGEDDCVCYRPPSSYLPLSIPPFSFPTSLPSTSSLPPSPFVPVPPSSHSLRNQHSSFSLYHSLPSSLRITFLLPPLLASSSPSVTFPLDLFYFSFSLFFPPSLSLHPPLLPLLFPSPVFSPPLFLPFLSLPPSSPPSFPLFSFHIVLMLVANAPRSYALIATATDYDSWCPSSDSITAAEVFKTLKANADTSRLVAATEGIRYPYKLLHFIHIGFFSLPRIYHLHPCNEASVFLEEVGGIKFSIMPRSGEQKMEEKEKLAFVLPEYFGEDTVLEEGVM